MSCSQQRQIADVHELAHLAYRSGDFDCFRHFERSCHRKLSAANRSSEARASTWGPASRFFKIFRGFVVLLQQLVVVTTVVERDGSTGASSMTLLKSSIASWLLPN